MPIIFNNTVFPSGHTGPTLQPSGNQVTVAGSSPGRFTVNGTINTPGDVVQVTNEFNFTSNFVATQYDNPGQILLQQQGTLNNTLFSNTPLQPGLNTVTFTNNTVGDFVVVCFASGTRILTDQGEVAVEKLREGMLVAVADAGGRVAGHRPIRWIGRQTVRCADGWRAGQAAIRIKAGALAEGMPTRDLVVSMGHGIALGGHWVRAGALVNGATILEEPAPASGTMTYWHVEVEGHAILLAEGAPAESYLEDGNRAAFDNGVPGVLGLFLSGDPSCGASYAERACLPLTNPGLPGFAEIQASVLARIPAVTGQSLVTDPALRITGGDRVAAEADGAFTLPAGSWPGGVRILSRSAIPMQVIPGSLDRRRLGVAVAAIELRAGTRRRVIAADDPRLDTAAGFHAAEADGGRRWRWTSGSAELPAELLADFGVHEALDIRLVLSGDLPYVAERPGSRAA